MDSILTSVKSALGIQPDYVHFDTAIIMHINTAFSTLNQLKVGPKDGFAIQDETSKWSDFIGDNKILNMVQTYVFMSVKLIFDPPTVGSVMESYKNKIAELEFRLNIETDRGETSAWNNVPVERTESGLLE